MADEEKKDAPESGEKKGGGKGPLKLLLGVVLLIAAGGGIALMAMPKKERGPEAFSGPWSFTFFDKDVVANTLDDNFSRYFTFQPSCSYFAYDQLYPDGRKADPDFLPSLQEAMSNVVARYRLNDIMIDGGGEEMALGAHLEQVCEPILFPVHIGESKLPLEADPKSGLRPGESHERRSTFRGAFLEHHLEVDAKAKTIQFDGGEAVAFVGSETDLEVRTADGRSVFVDVTKMKSGFDGSVNVGVQGRIRQVHLGTKRAQ